MLSPVAVFFLLFPAIIYGEELTPYHERLDCNIVTGDTNYNYLNLSRPLENGDEVIWRGTVLADATTARFDISRPEPHAIAVHIRQDFPKLNSIFNEKPIDKWIAEMHGEQIFSKGEKFELGARLVGNNFEIRKNGQLIYTYKVRHPASLKRLTQISQTGQLTMASIEMKCAHPKRS